jgi:DNA-directed RNA polymerase specialized sigma24 family protein
MKRNWVLTQEAFDKLLDWLDSDRDEAGRKYETIRLRLIKIFTCRGCFAAEELTDEIINRVAVKVADPAFVYEGDPALYFYAFAPNLQQEYLRKSRLRADDVSDEDSHMFAAAIEPADDEQPELECLDRCLDHLPAENRRLVLEYYQDERQAKINHRKQLAIEFGIAVNALRIRAHRIRRALEQCVRDCVEQQPAH